MQSMPFVLVTRNRRQDDRDFTDKDKIACPP